MIEIKKGIYKHFKGKNYEVLGVAKDCENPQKEYVVYKALYSSDEFGEGQIWVRELSDFLGEKEIDGKKVKRFEFINEKKLNIKIKKLISDARVPEYAHPGDAGLDLFSCEDCEIHPGKRKLVSTGISIELPQGFVSLITSFS